MEKVGAPCADWNKYFWEKLIDVGGQYLSYQGEEKLKDEMMQNPSYPREVMNPREMQVPTTSTRVICLRPRKHFVAEIIMQLIEDSIGSMCSGQRNYMRDAPSHYQGKVLDDNSAASPIAWGEATGVFSHQDRNSAIPSAGGGESDSFPGGMYSGRGEGEGEGSNIPDESSHKEENMSGDTAPPCGPSSSEFAATAPASTALSRRHYIYSLSAEGHVFGSHFGFSIKAAASLPDV